jgi:hypothetical protein
VSTGVGAVSEGDAGAAEACPLLSSSAPQGEL